MKSACYITFATTFYAIRSEELLKNKGYHFKMVPVPRMISSSCGTALYCDCIHLKELKKHLDAEGVEMENFYRVEEVGLKAPKLITLDLLSDIN